VGLRWDRRTPYRFKDRLRTGIEKESVPKIIVNDTIYLFFKTAIIILVISSHDSFRVLFDKIASAYFICKVYLYFSIGKANPGNQHCANSIGTLSFSMPVRRRSMKRYGVRLSQRSPTAANPLLQVATVGPAGKRQKANTDLLLETSDETLQFRRPDSACVRKKTANDHDGTLL